MYRAIYFDAGSTLLYSHPRPERIRLSLLSLGFDVEKDRLQEAMGQAQGQIRGEWAGVRTVEQEEQ